MKICTVCGINKDDSEFHKDSTRKSGLSCKCKECKKKYSEENKDILNDRAKKWQKDNVEAARIRSKLWQRKKNALIKDLV